MWTALKIADMVETQSRASVATNELNHVLSTNGRSQGPLTGKHIILIHSSLKLGGAELQSLHLATHLLHEQGARVEMWGLSAPGELADRCDRLGIPWRSLPLDWRPGRWNRARDLLLLARVLRSVGPDVLLPYCDIPNVVCGAVWRWTGARLCVWNQRGMDTMCRDSSLARRVIRKTKCFISNSAHRRDYLIDTFNIPPERVHVIRNGVALGLAALTREEWREKLGLDAGAFVACMVANLNWYKDHATVVKAWRLVVDQAGAANPVLLLAGRFSDKATELKALCFDLDLRNAVRFLDFVEDVPGLLGAADLCVFSSEGEGIPNGVLEAMAARLPVAAIDDPSIREAVGTDGGAWLSPRGDASALASRIIDLAADQVTRARLGSLNRARIEREFSVRTMCEQTSSLISSALSDVW